MNEINKLDPGFSFEDGKEIQVLTGSEGTIASFEGIMGKIAISCRQIPDEKFADKRFVFAMLGGPGNLLGLWI